MAPQARFTEDQKTVLKDLILGDNDLQAHIIYARINSKDVQTELWKSLVERFNEKTGQNYVKEQLSNCLSRIRKYETTERQRRQEEGETDFSDLWLTLDQDVGVKSEPRASPASFSPADINHLKNIITADNEIRGVIFHGDSSVSNSAVWARLVDKFNEASGKSYNKNQIYRCLTRLKYKEKNKGSTEKKPRGRPRGRPSGSRSSTRKRKEMDDFVVDDDDYDSRDDDEWKPSKEEREDSTASEEEEYSDNEDYNMMTASTGMDNIFGLIKGGTANHEVTQQFDDLGIDWSEPLTAYMSAISPGLKQEQDLMAQNYQLYHENLKLKNKKLKIELRDLCKL